MSNQVIVCNRCDTPVSFDNVTKGYYATCPSHDEDLFESEVKIITSNNHSNVEVSEDLEAIPFFEESGPLTSALPTLADLCVIEASGTFLTEHLTLEQYNGNEDELNEFIQDHVWQPLENNDPRVVLNMIDDLGSSIERFVQENILDKQPNYAVIWHYEGQTPYLFTCRAKSAEEAEALLSEYLIDHESNAVEFHIDSIEQLKL